MVGDANSQVFNPEHRNPNAALLRQLNANRQVAIAGDQNRIANRMAGRQLDQVGDDQRIDSFLLLGQDGGDQGIRIRNLQFSALVASPLAGQCRTLQKLTTHH